MTFFLWIVSVLTLIVFAPLGGWQRIRRTLTVGLPFLTLAFFVWLAGAGIYRGMFTSLVNAVSKGFVAMATGQGPQDLQAAFSRARRQIERSRAGFVRTGGDTSLVGRDSAEAQAALSRSRAGPPAQAEVMSRLATGLAALFVPISLLKALSLVELEGGRGLLFVTDIDTVFFDATLVVVAMILYRRRTVVRQRLPFVFALGLLAVLSAVLMAYIITNSGTMFRLRALVAIPIWLLTFAAATGRFRQPAETSLPAGPVAQEVASSVLNNTATYQASCRGGSRTLRGTPGCPPAAGDPEYRYTPLMMAAQNADIATALQLIACGSDVNARASDRYTALMFAANAGAVPLVEALLRAGAEVNARQDGGMTALGIIGSEFPEIASLLRRYGGQP